MTSGAWSDIRRQAKAHVVVESVDHPEIGDDELRHLGAVLRLADGEPITITDGVGNWRSGRFRNDAFEPSGEGRHEQRPGRHVTIGVAIPKGDRPEWIVQKLTELGVASIVFVDADRSVVNWSGERGHKKLHKLQRTAREALRQSRGVWLPTVTGPTPAADLLPTAYAAEPGAPIIDLARTPASVFLIGPEGGWSDVELDSADGTFGLGPTILRVETAALAVAARALEPARHGD